MNLRLVPLFLGILSATGIPVSTPAGAMVIVAGWERYIEIPGGREDGPQTEFAGDFYSSLGGGDAPATQNSSVRSALSYSGSGAASCHLSGEGGEKRDGTYAWSVFWVDFEIEEEYMIDLAGVASVVGGNPDGNTGVLLSDDNGMWYDSETMPDGLSAVLDPGVYHFRASAHATAAGDQLDQDASYAFSLDLTPTTAPVPEPSAWLLMGMGLVGIALHSRRRLRS